jgi:hypothetical protein
MKPFGILVSPQPSRTASTSVTVLFISARLSGTFRKTAYSCTDGTGARP